MENEEKNKNVQDPVSEPESDNLSNKVAEESAEGAENADAADVSEEAAAAEEEKGGFFNRKGKKDGQLKKQVEDLEKQLEESRAKMAEMNDRFSRLYSEFDNYKKRTNREKLDLMATASERVIVELLPVIDDFERAIQANEKVSDIDSVKEGFRLIYNKMGGLLKRFDVEEIAAKGEEFNTDFHEAVTHFPAPTEEEKGKVMDVAQKGYKIKDKVIRYSKVVVGQ